MKNAIKKYEKRDAQHFAEFEIPAKIHQKSFKNPAKSSKNPHKNDDDDDDDDDTGDVDGDDGDGGWVGEWAPPWASYEKPQNFSPNTFKAPTHSRPQRMQGPNTSKAHHHHQAC